jgi:hypothetical protein
MRCDFCPPIASYKPSTIIGWYDVTIDGETVETVDRETYAQELCARIVRLGYRAYRAFNLDR